MSEVRLCKKCNTEKPVSEFHKRNTSWCKVCACQHAKKYFKRPEVYRRKLDAFKFRKFGMTRSQILAMLDRQDGRCEICRKPIDSIDGRGTHIDHDHTRGHVRGILCNHCNLGLGHFKDSIAVLRNAIEYLQLDTPATPASVRA